VVDARKAAPKDDAVVVGRIREMTRGFAAFTLVDASLAYCGESTMEDPCETPWDYCCIDAEELASKSVSVVVQGPSGRVEKADLPELRHLDLVVVRGRLVKNDKGDVEVAATGWWRKERPTLPATVKFP
jgi:hypothetical protein